MWAGLALVAVVLLLLFWQPWGGIDDHEEPASSAPEKPDHPPPAISIGVPQQRGTFRGSYRTSFFSFFPLTPALAIAIFAVMQLERLSVGDYIVVVLIALVVAPVPCALGAWVFCRMFKVCVEPSGLQAPSAVGFPRFMRWDDMQVVGKFWVFTLPYLRIKSVSSGKRIWLPLFLQQK